MTGSTSRAKLFVVDAFAGRQFTGNPAAVMPMDAFEPDATLQALAAENNLAETAFLVPASGDYRIRWFTPTTEVPLCGHATLASAAVVLERLEPTRTEVTFLSASGPLKVRRRGAGFTMDFPVRRSDPAPANEQITQALGARPRELGVNSFNYMAVFATEADVRGLAPDMAAVARLDRPGVIVTAPGAPPYDFVNRYFAPAKGIPEDPVTGSAFCMLTPYWTARLGGTHFHAFQASARGGEVECSLVGERVLLSGTCVFYSEGTVEFETRPPR